MKTPNILSILHKFFLSFLYSGSSAITCKSHWIGKCLLNVSSTELAVHRLCMLQCLAFYVPVSKCLSKSHYYSESTKSVTSASG